MTKLKEIVKLILEEKSAELSDVAKKNLKNMAKRYYMDGKETDGDDQYVDASRILNKVNSYYDLKKEFNHPSVKFAYGNDNYDKFLQDVENDF